MRNKAFDIIRLPTYGTRTCIGNSSCVCNFTNLFVFLFFLFFSNAANVEMITRDTAFRIAYKFGITALSTTAGSYRDGKHVFNRLPIDELSCQCLGDTNRQCRSDIVYETTTVSLTQAPRENNQLQTKQTQTQTKRQKPILNEPRAANATRTSAMSVVNERTSYQLSARTQHIMYQTQKSENEPQ